jgi:hypothetical protein
MRGQWVGGTRDSKQREAPAEKDLFLARRELGLSSRTDGASVQGCPFGAGRIGLCGYAAERPGAPLPTRGSSTTSLRTMLGMCTSSRPVVPGYQAIHPCC